jgi:hypothetical protein
MKRVLVDYMGGICHIVVPGGDEREEAVYVSSEFPVVEGPNASSKWIDAPDEVDKFWRLEAGEWVDRSRPFTDPERARVVAYGQIGNQLDMIYKDMVNGTSNWQEHIAKVKAEIPMDPDLLNEGRKEPITHSMDRPSWSFLPNSDDEITV